MRRARELYPRLPGETLSDTPEYDWKSISIMLAADQARMCEIVLKADALAVALRNHMGAVKIREALEDYEIVRRGQ